VKIVVFADCDDTLFTTAKKVNDAKIEDCDVYSYLEDGSPSGYQTPKMKAIAGLLKGSKIIPVTARSQKVLARCHVPQYPSICSNGGKILNESGVVDYYWQNQIIKHLKNYDIEEIYRSLISKLSADYRHWVVYEDDLPMYIVIKSNNDSTLDNVIESKSIPEGWKIHQNGNNLAIIPPWISKRKAVSYLMEKIMMTSDQTLFIGMGDSESDLGFMNLCDYTIYPKNSQINNLIRRINEW
jgi:hydroxymethylpyrimidine pyrophosphatase-like HAD family hydrolase